MINATQHCIERALQTKNIKAEYVDRLLLSMLFSASKDPDHARAIRSATAAFTGAPRSASIYLPLALTNSTSRARERLRATEYAHGRVSDGTRDSGGVRVRA